MSRVFFPAWASRAAMLVAVKVLPSPGCMLETRMVFCPSLLSRYCRLVLNPLKASVVGWRGLLLPTNTYSSFVMSLYAGTPPLTGSFVASRSSLTLSILSNSSRRRTDNPMATTRANRV